MDDSDPYRILPQSWSLYSVTGTSMTRLEMLDLVPLVIWHLADEAAHRVIVLSFDKNESYAENNCILALLLGGAVPGSARDIPTTRHPTRITPSPSLGQTGAPVGVS